MGSKPSKQQQPEFSTAEYGDIFLDLNKDTFFPGETVEGNVYLLLHKPFPGNQVSIVLKGTEFIYYADAQSKLQDDSNVSDYIHRTHKEKTLEMKIPLFSWGNSREIPQGQYIFPYQFSLPLNIPGTFFQKRWCLLGDISYSIQALIDFSSLTSGRTQSSGRKEEKKEMKMKYKCKLVILEPPQVNGMYQRGIDLNQDLKMKCLCFDQGSSLITANFEKNYYTPGETARVTLRIDNRKAKYPCTRVTVCLQQVLTFLCQRNSMTRRYTLAQKEIGGVKAKELSKDNVITMELPPPEVGDADAYTGHKNLPSQLFEEKESISYSNPSTRGKLITSFNTLNIFCEYKGWFGAKVVKEVNIPVTIHAVGVKPFGVTAPQDWLPKKMETNCSVAVFRSVYNGEKPPDVEEGRKTLSKQGSNGVEAKANGKASRQKVQVELGSVNHDETEIFGLRKKEDGGGGLGDEDIRKNVLEDSKIDDVEKAKKISKFETANLRGAKGKAYENESYGDAASLDLKLKKSDIEEVKIDFERVQKKPKYFANK